MENFENKAKAYALKNAISYNGKCNSGAVISGLFNEGLKKENIKEYSKKINEIVNEVNNLTVEEQEKELEKLKDLVSEREVREGLPELPNANKGVVMRIAPSPSGPLHLMHAINLSLNYLYVKKYGGKLYVRIEDTNPENIYSKAYEMIENESKWLTKNLAEIIIQSDRIEIYYQYIKELIEKNSSYVCECSGDSFREFSKQKKECPCRNISKEENKKRWEKMLRTNGYKPGEVVLRFKSDMTHPNPAMRDFPLARINISSHPRQGNKYRVWPLMNLAVTVDDIELGMTHVIRGKDHKDNSKRQEMIYELLGKKYPWVAFTGMTNFVGMKFSTRQMRQDIEEEKFSGWDDERLPTVTSLKKRGYNPICFHKFAEHTRNLSEVDKTMPKEELFRLLDEFNKE